MKRIITVLHLTRCSAGLALVMLGACGEDEPSAAMPAANQPSSGEVPTKVAGEASAPDAGLLAPPPAGGGVQYVMKTELAPGEESEHCMFVQSPADEIYVQRDEIRFTSGSHHVLLYETAYREFPTANEDGAPVDPRAVFDCSDGATDGWDVTRLIGGSQNGSGESLLSFPNGVAKRVPGGTVLMINAHYINTSDQPAQPEIRINLYTIAKSEVEQEGDLLFLYNSLIHVGAGMSARARMRCSVHRDITIANVQSHMHRRGVGYAAMVEGEQPFYENDRWEEVPVQHFAEGLKVTAGSRLDYYCDYQNDEDHDIVQGARSTDEMCMLVGSYYPADPNTSVCNDENGRDAPEWVGNGTASCAQTMTCVTGKHDLGGLADCMQDADPAVAQVASTALLCALHAGNNAASVCAAEIQACLSQ